MSALLPHFAGIAPLTPQPVEQAEVLDLTHLVAVLWRRKIKLLAAALFAALIGGGWATFVATPYYQATAVLMLSAPEDQLPALGALVPGLSTGNSAANTEVEIIRSRNLIGAVVDDLALETDPEFNPELDRGMAFVTKGFLRQWVGPTWISQEMVLSPEQIRTLTVDRMLQAISVSNIPDSMVFEVAVESEQAAKAAAIANALAAHYIHRQIEEKSYANEQIVQWLSTRVALLQTQLETAQNALAQFSASMELITPETHASLAVRLKELRLKITIYETTESQRSTVRTQTQLSELRVLEQELSEMFDRQSQDLVQVQQLEHEVLAAQLIYAQFLERFNESAAQMDITQPDSTILSRAEAPVVPAQPKPALVILMTGVLGALLMGIRILQRDVAHKSFHTQQELEDETGLVALGQSAQLKRQRFRSMVSRVVHGNEGENADSLYYLHGHILPKPDQKSRVVMITSSLPNEGRTVLTLALAHSIAKTGQRVLVIDGDLHRHGLQKMLQTPFNGLYSALGNGAVLDESVWRCDDLHIDILSGAAKGVVPATLFSLPAFGHMIRCARDAYDVVLIDTPPALAVPDAQIIGARVDSILYAVKWGQTDAKALNDGLSSLRKGGLKVDGLVLTQVRPKYQRQYMPDYHAGLRNYRRAPLTATYSSM